MKKGQKTSSDKNSNVALELRRLGVAIEHVDDKVSLTAEMVGDLAINMTIVKRDIEIMKTDVEFIKGGLKKKVDVEEFSALTRRVSLLEKRR